ncbi:envelope integrity protein Cei [Pseudonocardia sp. C8]|uniref:envelope integrity protein Cei n=1 Tax=Pseudonocardia sp. C8 TaxID=2762759 RepID=UPI001642A4C8|nr:envelope integrity protein Cei [Pseudonocardia sp. C8]MBC3191552.1 envelope integrity protein Cei [Pseudonocardia sp. C8]
MRLRLPRSARPYERRRTGPIVATSVVLAVLAVATWTVVLSTASEGPSSTDCAAPTSGSLPGSEISRSDLDGVQAAPPRDVRFQVLNAGGQRGQANLVAAQLKDLEFAEATTPGNDPAFPEGNLDCIGQMRFGPEGESAAATLALALPCVELIRDERPGPVVDVVVGTAFTDVAPGRAARDALDQLASQGTEGGAQADPGLLSQAREGVCT